MNITYLTNFSGFSTQDRDAFLLITQKNQAWANWSGDAIVLEKTPLGCLARNFVYKPIYLSNANLGDEVKVKVVETRDDHLVGQIVGYVKA